MNTTEVAKVSNVRTKINEIRETINEARDRLCKADISLSGPKPAPDNMPSIKADAPESTVEISLDRLHEQARAVCSLAASIAMTIG